MTLKGFGHLITGYNKLIDKLGGGKLGILKASNEFDKLAENVEKALIETDDYKHDFEDFTTFMGRQGDRLKKFLKGVGESLGVGGDISTAPKFQRIPSKKPTSSFGVMTPVELPDDLKNNAVSLMDVFMELDATILRFGESLGKVLMAGAQNFQDFASHVRSSVKSVLGSLLAEAVGTAVTRAMNNAAIAFNPALIPVIAGLAGGLAKTAFNSLIPAFAEGGLVSGATLGLIGEGRGTSMSNPEVVAPLDKLKSMIGQGNGSIEVFGSISGQDILLSSTRARNNRTRTRGY